MPLWKDKQNTAYIFDGMLYFVYPFTGAFRLLLALTTMNKTPIIIYVKFLSGLFLSFALGKFLNEMTKP